MFFRVEKNILELGTGICVGIVTAERIDNTLLYPQITTLIEEQVSIIKNGFMMDSIKDLKELKIYNETLKSFNINSNKYPCSIESLLLRILKKGEIPHINPVVDLANYISLKYKVPVGVHDIDTFSNDLWLRRATDNDCLNEANNNDKDPLALGEPVYICENEVRTRRWIWRQMEAGRVNEKSKNFIFLIDGFCSNMDTINQAINELAKKIQELFGVQTQTGMITQENTEFQFGKLTDKEQKIENQISIMLKGVAQHTEKSDIRSKILDAEKEGRPLRIKLGLDPSAPDIHIGHAVVLRKIRQLQDLGHTAIIIIGDYTGMIGDPTGKSKTRKQLTQEDVQKNANTYIEQIFKILDREKTEIHYNSEWLSKMNFGDVIELASKCTVARMLERDDFHNRYTNHLPLSVHEFFYPLMQAYDSVMVKADIELGGTDQTFNILMGRNIQRDYGQTPQLTLFMPLLEGIDGVEKMSKSLNNYIGINENPFIIYEKTMKIPDSLIIKYYNLCTDVHPEEVIKIKKRLDDGTNPRDIKMLLAHEITELYCGKIAADTAEQRFKSIYQKNVIPEDAPQIVIKTSIEKPFGEQIIDILVTDGYFKTKSEIRRLFLQGGVQLNNHKILNEKTMEINSDNAVLKIGKNKFFRISITD